MAMVCTSIYHTSWDQILGLVAAITGMVQGNMAMHPDIGHIMFNLKTIEMFQIGMYYFNVGSHRSCHSMALRMLEPIMQACTLEAAAGHEAKRIEGAHVS